LKKKNSVDFALMSNSVILLLDETKGQSSGIKEILLKHNGFCVDQAENSTDLLARLKSDTSDIILTLLSGQQADGSKSLLQQIKSCKKNIPVIIVSSKPQLDEAVSVMRWGAYDYLGFPLDPVCLIETIKRAASESGHGPDNNRSRGKAPYANIVGESEKISRVFSMIEKICDTDTTVLVQGESGTGKELIAKALHYQGERAKGPFVPVNCGAIPGELLESELFGHEKGAFTHAIRTRIGRFELADGGTVFLDEISEMSPMLQVKILRVLQERQFERIGGTKTITSDFRVIAATNRNLEEEVKEGRFREDLYYRLNVIPIEAPPLRERSTDIPLLVDYFIMKFNRSKRKVVSGVVPEVLSKFIQYSWPGNVRELENVIERMVILTPGEQLTLEDLPVRILDACGEGGVLDTGRGLEEIPLQGFMLSEVVSNFEKRLIVRALNQTGWVKNRAAKLLNVNRTTLIEKMKRYQVVNQQ
jgi:DNA-binding NtrC family response regulator